MESVPKVTSTNLQDNMYEGSPRRQGVGGEGENTTCIITETHAAVSPMHWHLGLARLCESPSAWRERSRNMVLVVP